MKKYQKIVLIIGHVVVAIRAISRFWLSFTGRLRASAITLLLQPMALLLLRRRPISLEGRRTVVVAEFLSARQAARVLSFISSQMRALSTQWLLAHEARRCFLVLRVSSAAMFLSRRRRLGFLCSRGRHAADRSSRRRLRFHRAFKRAAAAANAAAQHISSREMTHARFNDTPVSAPIQV